MAGNLQLTRPLPMGGTYFGVTAMGNTVMIHCDQCGVSSPRDVSELERSSDMRCHVCGAKFSEEANRPGAQQASKVIIVRAKRS